MFYVLFYKFDGIGVSIQKANSWDITETYQNMFEEYGPLMYLY